MRLLPAALLAVALAACGSPADKPEPAAPATPPATTAAAAPPDGGTYATADQLISALAAAGRDCTGYEETPGAIDALTRGSCDHQGREMIVSIYANHEDAAAHPQIKAEILRGVSDVHVVVGKNWTVSCETAEDCTAVDTALGGQTHNIPK